MDLWNKKGFVLAARKPLPQTPVLTFAGNGSHYLAHTTWPTVLCKVLQLGWLSSCFTNI